MNEKSKPLQKIIFGSPGTGKSFQVKTIASKELNIIFDEDFHFLNHDNIIRTVFHPEYTYADFMGKLLPLTQKDQVIYKFYPGHFLRVLGIAYNSLLENIEENFLLVIDELNRGNAASIFGTVFQLLDREDDGWSSYEVDISDMELVGLLEAMKLRPKIEDGMVQIGRGSGGSLPYETILREKIKDFNSNNNDAERVFKLLEKKRISIPKNLSIIATINTSDESIYYLDSAFKRRWDWEYVDAPSAPFSIEEDVPKSLQNSYLVIDKTKKYHWPTCVVGINEFIKSNSQNIRRVEDKQIGWWFLKPENDIVSLEKVKDKVLFYLWDSVFSRDKRPLEDLLSNEFSPEVKLRIYSDFLALAKSFMREIYNIGWKSAKENVYNDIPF